LAVVADKTNARGGDGDGGDGGGDGALSSKYRRERRDIACPRARTAETSLLQVGQWASQEAAAVFKAELKSDSVASAARDAAPINGQCAKELSALARAFLEREFQRERERTFDRDISRPRRTRTKSGTRKSPSRGRTQSRCN